MTPIHDALLAALVDLAIRAGREILAVAATDFAVEIKSDESPVTAADAHAEAVILAGLADLLPGVPVVAEEESAAGRRPATLGHRFLLVDPLDGTREFVDGSGEYTVNIALVEDGRPVVGVVHAPALGEIHAGRVGLGAAHGRIAPDGAIAWTSITTRPAPITGLGVLASRSHAGPDTEALLARLPVAGRIAAGSSLKFCRVAEGVADLYPRLGRTMEWDTAAGDAVLTAAGGCVVTLDGAPLAYGKRGRAEDADFANPWFLALGDVALIGTVVDKIQR